MFKWLLSKLRQFRSRRPVDFYNQGNGLSKQGRTGEAIAAYTRAIERMHMPTPHTATNYLPSSGITPLNPTTVSIARPSHSSTGVASTSN